jgi:hypothetical protein
LSLLGVASPPLLIHGRVGLDHVEGYTRAPAKLGESGVFDGVRACDLLHVLGSRIPYSGGGGGVHRGMHGVLRVGVWCAITPVSPLAATVL